MKRSKIKFSNERLSAAFKSSSRRHRVAHVYTWLATLSCPLAGGDTHLRAFNRAIFMQRPWRSVVRARPQRDANDDTFHPFAMALRDRAPARERNERYERAGH